MPSSILPQILLQVFFILLNAVFACAEIAVISMNDAKLAAMAAAGDKRAIRLAHLTSQPARFLATIQVAITLAGFLGSAFAADNFSASLTGFLVSLGIGIPASTLQTISVVIITLILSYFTLIFGELVPKRLAMKKSEQLALAISGLLSFIARLCAPIVSFLTFSTNFVLRLCGVDPNAEDDEVSEEEIRIMVDAGSQKGIIDQMEQQMIENVFDFDDITVGRFATHRTEAAILWAEDDPSEWERQFRESRHSVYPVCGDTADQVLGTLSIKDYYASPDKSREYVLSHLLKPAFYVPESIRASQLFQRMQERRSHFAVVLDEYGGTLGIVTMNALLEQLVGDLENDSTDAAPEDIVPQGEHCWLVQGLAPLIDVERALDFHLSDEYDTLSGYILSLYGSVPADGSRFTVETDALTIEVLGVEEHRVQSALLTLRSDPVPKAENTPAVQ